MHAAKMPAPSAEELAAMFMEISFIAFTTRELFKVIEDPSSTDFAAMHLLGILGMVADRGCRRTGGTEQCGGIEVWLEHREKFAAPGSEDPASA